MFNHARHAPAGSGCGPAFCSADGGSLTASADDPLYVLFGKRKSRSIPDSYVLSGIREPAPQLMKVVHNWLSWLNRLGGRYCSDVMDVSPSALVLSNLC